MKELGFKDLYDVVIKTTYPIEIGGKTVEVGEVVAAFDKIQIANFQEIKDSVVARGGYNNQGLVWWEETKEIKISFSSGVFSKEQLAIMVNGNLTKKEESSILLPYREKIESDNFGKIQTRYNIETPVFIYRADNYQKITDWTKINEKTISVQDSFVDYIVDYNFYYENPSQIITIGQPLIDGFLTLTAKTRTKDDITGHISTGIISIPRLKLMSKLSMRLGDNAIPLVGNLEAIAIPVGNRGQKRVMEFYFLNDDIDSDI